jgi:beta-glucuronidase
MSKAQGTPQVSWPLLAVPAGSLSLCGAWRFAQDLDNAGEGEGWADPALDDASWQLVDVPHTWNVMEHCADYQGVSWYRRRFTLPPGVRDAYVRLRFDAVCYLAHVWLDGAYLGQHEGGYTPFEFPVSGPAIPGAQNAIAVRVDNARAADRIPALSGWRLYGGIVRDVRLEWTSRAYIAAQRVVAVPHLAGPQEADRATISATLSVHNASSDPLEGTLLADVIDEATGQPVLGARPASPVQLLPGQQADVQLAAEVASPQLWHFDQPHMYRWVASLRGAGGQALHTAEVPFGIRSVELDEGRFCLNGEAMRLAGVTRHAESPGYGLAETVTLMAADYDDMKRLNTVFTRPVHYPQHEFILDYCDRKGILLIPELPAWQLNTAQMADPHVRQLARQQLREMIAASANHPCVWAWSVGNELESDTVAGRAFVRDMVAFVKSLDPTRPVGFASYHLLVGRPWADATQYADFVMMNQYFGTWHGPKDGLSLALDTVHLAWPDKPVVISEFGFYPHWEKIEGPAQLDPAQYYWVAEDVPPQSEAADAPRCRVIAEQMAVFRRKPFVAGAIFWSYQDRMGVVGADRSRRGSWWALREEYAPVRVEAVSFSPATDGTQRATVDLRTRGPVAADMPAYTLRGYGLHWTVASPKGDKTFSAAELPLPTLAPATGWSCKLDWPVPPADYRLTLRIVRPTGFAVVERTYNPQGEVLPGR